MFRCVLHNTNYKYLIANFQKWRQRTQVPINRRNSACDWYFLLELSPLYFTQKGLPIHTENSMLIKYPLRSLFLEQVTYCKLPSLLFICVHHAHYMMATTYKVSTHKLTAITHGFDEKKTCVICICRWIFLRCWFF